VENGLSYFARVVRPEIAYGRMPDVLIEAPSFVASSQALGRQVVLTERAAKDVRAAYGPLLPVRPDPEVQIPSLSEVVGNLPAGTRYVLCVLSPLRELTLDAAEIAATLRALAGGSAVTIPPGDYAAVAGRIGAPPRLVVSSRSPFRERVFVEGVPVDIRMESWLAADTIRRMGFGHVIAGRQHTLIVERGVSFVAFDDHGRAVRTAYASNIFALQPRFLIQPR